MIHLDQLNNMKNVQVLNRNKMLLFIYTLCAQSLPDQNSV